MLGLLVVVEAVGVLLLWLCWLAAGGLRPSPAAASCLAACSWLALALAAFLVYLGGELRSGSSLHNHT